MDSIVSTLPKKFLNSLPRLPVHERDNVVTRFPPAPSGCLHLGHVKAIVANLALAFKYNGKCLFRIDDTNPSLDSVVYEKMIREDVEALGFRFDAYSRTSDHLEEIKKFATRLLVTNKAYLETDDTETIRDKRNRLVASEARKKVDSIIEEQDQEKRKVFDSEKMTVWREFLDGNRTGVCLRLRIDMLSDNACLRDPVVYRSSNGRAAPMYDLACPLVDSFENVTVALRTSEYDSRNALYQWVLAACDLKPIRLLEFSKLLIADTVLSKRKLNALIEDGEVDGWNDARLATVRGLMNRGVVPEAMVRFVSDQGFSKKNGCVSLSGLWLHNRRFLDRSVPRYTCLEGPVALLRVSVVDWDCLSDTVLVGPKLSGDNNNVVQKTKALGTKELREQNKDSVEILIEHFDALLLLEMLQTSQSDQFTLLYWGNFRIDSVDDFDCESKVEKRWCPLLTFNVTQIPNGDPKTTSMKCTWIEKRNAREATLMRFGSDLKKTQISVLVEKEVIDQTESGDQVQFQRKGFYVRRENMWLEHFRFEQKKKPSCYSAKLNNTYFK